MQLETNMQRKAKNTQNNMQNAKINIAYAILIIDFDILFLSLGGHVYYLCFPAFC
jgi:hypothetical protein